MKIVYSYHEVNKEFTEIVNHYLSTGYTINTATMNTNGDEITKIDLADITEKEIILQCCPPRISNSDVKIDINTEYNFLDFDFYILNQQEYYNYEGCVPDIDEEPESTLLFVFEPNFLKKLTEGNNDD